MSATDMKDRDDITADHRRRPTVDFNHEARAHAENWPNIYREMREKCPVAWSKNHGGYWVATGYAEILEMAQNNAVFRSGKTFDPATGHVEGGVTIPETPLIPGLPIECDKPEWDAYRKLINRRFAPKAAEARRDNVRKYATALVNRFIETGHCDIVNDFTSPLPALVTMEIIGFPLEEWRQFADPLHAMAYTAKQDPGFPGVMQNLDWMHGRIREEIASRRENPTDDMISHLIDSTIDGRSLTDDEVHEFCLTMLTGGVDTTTGLMTNVLIYLAQNPEERRRLVENPELLPVAREEFVRFFSPIHALGRNVSAEIEIGGQKMCPGEKVLLAWSAANRDPDIFDRPEELVLDRFPNRHIGFGAGMHRCAGSFMARVMFEVMFDEWTRRIPEYAIDMEKAVPYASVATVNGWVTVPATFAPGPKVETDFIL